jgi:DNA-binding response OmpR family regulator
VLLVRNFTVTIGEPDAAGGTPAISGCYAVIVLDLTDSHDAALALCRRLRDAGVTSPILMVHPQGGQDTLLDAFEAGTDAYMCGSIEDAELLGQIGSLYRRPAVSVGNE